MSSSITEAFVRKYSVGKKNPYNDELNICDKKISLNGHMNIN